MLSKKSLAIIFTVILLNNGDRINIYCADGGIINVYRRENTYTSNRRI